jgi:hypothetical protein
MLFFCGGDKRFIDWRCCFNIGINDKGKAHNVNGFGDLETWR